MASTSTSSMIARTQIPNADVPLFSESEKSKPKIKSDFLIKKGKRKIRFEEDQESEDSDARLHSAYSMTQRQRLQKTVESDSEEEMDANEKMLLAKRALDVSNDEDMQLVSINDSTGSIQSFISVPASGGSLKLSLEETSGCMVVKLEISNNYENSVATFGQTGKYGCAPALSGFGLVRPNIGQSLVRVQVKGVQVNQLRPVR
ncbi:hypothetical protein TKK_0018056 [Trichogramma kaykai]